jgi:hypothetical protein
MSSQNKYLQYLLAVVGQSRSPEIIVFDALSFVTLMPERLWSFLRAGRDVSQWGVMSVSHERVTALFAVVGCDDARHVRRGIGWRN